MENGGDIVRVKEELHDTLPDGGEDYIFDSLNSCKTKNNEVLPFSGLSANHTNEVIALQEKLDEKIDIDFECKYVIPKLESSSAVVCKPEYKSCLPIVKVEKEFKANHLNHKDIYNFDKKRVRLR
ncbi:uncharacterized protein LOC106657263 [Trichogramma pretiosum]|uniref:uncharacterized protein LOC106657263 n=1 Tax=Trichogramma pretiosum TaxID=7493 RepID=UPI0006C952CC|nr:uncharacterized protein LOC106657263 [Trichogramma pretiosum]